MLFYFFFSSCPFTSESCISRDFTPLSCHLLFCLFSLVSFSSLSYVEITKKKASSSTQYKNKKLSVGLLVMLAIKNAMLICSIACVSAMLSSTLPNSVACASAMVPSSLLPKFSQIPLEWGFEHTKILSLKILPLSVCASYSEIHLRSASDLQNNSTNQLDGIQSSINNSQQVGSLKVFDASTQAPIINENELIVYSKPIQKLPVIIKNCAPKPHLAQLLKDQLLLWRAGHNWGYTFLTRKPARIIKSWSFLVATPYSRHSMQQSIQVIVGLQVWCRWSPLQHFWQGILLLLLGTQVVCRRAVLGIRWTVVNADYSFGGRREKHICKLSGNGYNFHHTDPGNRFKTCPTIFGCTTRWMTWCWSRWVTEPICSTQMGVVGQISKIWIIFSLVYLGNCGKRPKKENYNTPKKGRFITFNLKLIEPLKPGVTSKNLLNCSQLTCSMLQPSCHPNSTCLHV
ncbi:putative signal peptide protein [Puccinia sorghi]|uniref:Putative signal peptide protein n=1 Tax=Puccinia sorghi TaxID=27349 RepID=A0A0L6UEU0_9BASI|nr:putative signal peptide protein [Puccinia sorghi]